MLAFTGCGAGDFRMLIPGACAHVYPPVPDGGEGLIAPRADWLYARRTSGAHLQLLLCRAGVGQRCEVGRRSVLDMPAAAAALRTLAAAG